MKKALIIAGGLLFAFALQAQAQDADTQTSAQTQANVNDSMGGQPSTTSMSGGPAVPQGPTRADVYQQLIQSQKNGEAARLQDFYKGGN